MNKTRRMVIHVKLDVFSSKILLYFIIFYYSLWTYCPLPKCNTLIDVAIKHSIIKVEKRIFIPLTGTEPIYLVGQSELYMQKWIVNVPNFAWEIIHFTFGEIAASLAQNSLFLIRTFHGISKTTSHHFVNFKCLVEYFKINRS